MWLCKTINGANLGGYIHVGYHQIGLLGLSEDLVAVASMGQREVYR
jgi:hypothetical protein